MSTELRPPSLEKGIPAALVMVGAVVVLGILTTLVYFLGVEISKVQSSTSVSPDEKAPIEARPTTVATSERTNQTNTSINTRSAVPVTLAPGVEPTKTELRPTGDSSKTLPTTFDIGAYLTYGGQAFTLNRAVAKLSAESHRMIVAFYEEASPKNLQNPPLAVIFEFKAGASTCSVQNLKSMALVFNLRALGDVPAQRVELARTTQNQMIPELGTFACSLKAGTKLNLQLLGADPKILKPHGGTFGWGVRLTQEIS